MTCKRCQGNGEIVTDWNRYLKPRAGDVGDEAVADCPDCCGYGSLDALKRAAAADNKGPDQ